jgi:hypothetical protein
LEEHLHISSYCHIMLTVYLYNAPKPPDCFDLSLEKLDELADKALAIFSHHKTATIRLSRRMDADSHGRDTLTYRDSNVPMSRRVS